MGLLSPMTRVYHKLLGPCYKTGRMGHRLYTGKNVGHTTTPTRSIGQTHMCGWQTERTDTAARINDSTKSCSIDRPQLTQVSSPKDCPLDALQPTTPHDPAHSARKCIATPPNNTDAATDQRQQSDSTTTEYVPDTSTPFASITSVSRSLALSFQSTFQLSLTVLVFYRFRGHI